MPRKRKRKAKAVKEKKIVARAIKCQENDEPPGYQEFNRIPNIHMLNKPSWATGEDASDNGATDGSLKSDLSKGMLGFVFSLPIIALASLPLLAVFSLTLFKYGALPDSLGPMTAYVFQNPMITEIDSAAIPLFWALALVVFVPWSAVVCRLENIVSGVVA